jgi:hypothetical protein
MGQQNSTVTTRFDFVTNKGSVSDAVQQVERVERAYDDMDTSAKKGEVSVLGVNNELSQSYGDISSQSSALASVLGELNPELAGAVSGFADLTGAIEYLPRAGEAIQVFAASLSPVGLGLTAVVGIAAAGVALLTHAYQENYEAAKKRADLERDIALELTDMTSQQVSERQMAIERETNVLNRLYLENLAELERSGYRVGELFPTTEQQALIQSNQELAASIAENQVQVELYSEALVSGVTIANDIAVAEAALTEERQKQIDAEMALRNMTVEQAEDRIAAIEMESEILARLSAESGTLTSAEADRLIALNQELNAINELLPEMREREAALEAEQERLDDMKDLFDAVQKASDKAADAQDKFTEAQTAYFDAIEENREKVEEILAAQAEAEAAALTDKNKALAEADTQAADERIKAYEAHEKKRLDILKRANAAISNAIYTRDALAYVMAVAAKEDELEANDDALETQLKTIDDNLRKQQKVIEQRYQEQLATAKENADKALAVEKKRADDEIALKRAAAYNAQTDLSNAMNAERNLRNLYLNLFGADLKTAFETGFGNAIDQAELFVANLPTLPRCSRPRLHPAATGQPLSRPVPVRSQPVISQPLPGWRCRRAAVGASP